MAAHEYEVIRDIAEIGARVWDVILWDWPDVFLYRIDRDGVETMKKYPAHWTFLLLKYRDHLRPLSPRCPAPIELARIALGASQWGGQGRPVRPFRLVE